MGQNTAHDKKNGARADAGKRRGRLRRVLRWSGLGAIALLIAGVALHTIIIREVAEYLLEQQVGCAVHVGSARFGSGGSVMLRGVRLSAPGVPGEGGVFLEAASVRAEIDWTSLAAGGQGVRRLRLSDPIVRLSQDADSGELNLLEVGGASGAGRGGGRGSGRTVTPLPEVDFIAGRVEFGEHDGKAYTVLASIPVEGQVRVPSIAIPEYEIDLTERIGDERRPPMRLTGDFNVETLSGALRLVDLDLDRWQGWSAPVAARALWKQMNIRGRIAEASFTADPDSNINASFTLAGVRLTMPIESPDMDADLITARDVDGVVRFTPGGVAAELVGIVEDLPARVEFRTDGLSVNAPLTCTITTERFLVREKPDLLSFVPGEARDLFNEFGGPTGEVSGYVTLSRGAPMGSSAAPIVARGELRIERGKGAHEVFPYPVESISGAIRFDEEKIELIDVRGVCPTGATLTATGTIAPPAEGKVVHIEMLLGDIPTDETLDRAMPTEAQRVLRTLIDRPALEALRRRRLLRTSEDADRLMIRLSAIARELEENAPGAGGSSIRRVELLRERDQIRALLKSPAFDLGGFADATVRIDREGPDDDLHTTIDIRFDRAGLLPEPFPYPFMATNFNIVVTGDGVTATADKLEGPTGARGDLIAAITFPDETNGSPGATLIDIDLTRGPVDALLLAATPTQAGEGSANLYDVVSGLRYGGDLTGSILIDSQEPDEFRADLTLSNVGLALDLAPGGEGGAQEPLEVTGLSGPMTVTDTRVVVGPIVGEFRGSPVRVRGGWSEDDPDSGDGPSPIRARIELDRFDLQSRIDPVIALLGEESAERWASLRDSRSVHGVLDLSTDLTLLPGEPPVVRTALTNVRDLSFTAGASVVEIERLNGEIVADQDRLRLIGCGGSFRLDHRLDGRLRLNGDVPLNPGRPVQIEVALTETRFDAQFLRSLSGSQGAPASLQQWIDERQPGGVCDATLTVRRETGAEGLDWALAISPRALELQSGEDTLRLEASGPGAVVTSEGGEIERLRLENEDCVIDASGRWRHGSRAAVDLDFTIDAQRMPRGLGALLPPDVHDLIESLEIGIERPWELTRGELRWRTDAQHFVGEARFRGLRCDPGVAITDADGDAVMRIERSEERSDPEIEFAVRTDAMRLAGVRMTGGEMSLHSGALPGRLVIDRIGADTHGGRFTGQVTIDTTTQGDDAHDDVAWYEAMFDFAGVEVQSLLSETASLADSERPGSDSGKSPFEGFTGTFDGRLSMAGAVGDQRSRRGRAVFRVEGGELTMAPLAMPIIELSNLRPPTGEALERADAEVYLEGSIVHVEELRLRSDSISIVGTGEVTWPGMALSMAFNSRSNHRVPLLSDLVEGLRNELITTLVTGTLLDPKFRTEALPGTRKALDEAFGEPDSGAGGGQDTPIRRSGGADGVSSVPPSRDGSP